MRLAAALLALLLACAPRAAAQSPGQPGSSERDYRAGRRLLDAAIRATGDSAALAGLGTLTGSFCASAVEIGQSARPDAPYDTIRASGRRIYDLAGRRYAQDWSTEFRGGIPLALHEVVTDTSAYSVDLRGGLTLGVASSGVPASLRRVEDNAPYAPLALLDRARRNATSLRIVRGSGGARSRPAVLFADRGGIVTLEFDARTGLLASAEALFDNWSMGLTPARTEFRDYRRVGGVQLATRLTTWFQHSLSTEVTFPDLARAAAPPSGAFLPPGEQAHSIPIGGALRITVDSVAPHVSVVRFGQTAGPNFGYNPPFAYAQLVVELAHGLLVVDAPWSSTVQQAVIDSLRVRFPDKPVAMVGFTHYHSDHFGGLRPYLMGGVTLIATPGNRGLIERVAATGHPTDPAEAPSRPAVAPRIETFTGVRTIDDPDAPVELHEIGGGHADEMVVAYLPRQRLLFTADLFGVFPVRGGPGGSYAAERGLARYAHSRSWTVETVVSGHGAISPGSALDSVSVEGGKSDKSPPPASCSRAGARLGT